MTGRRALVATVLVTLVLLAGCALYVAAFVGLPNDGTVIDLTAASQPGLRVRVLRPGSALQTGDFVVAVNGQPIDDWVGQAIAQPWLLSPVPTALDYTVLRDGSTVIVRQPLLRPYLPRVLAEIWTTLLFLVYLQLIGLFVFGLRPHLPTAQLLLVFTSAMCASSVIFFLGLPLSALQHGWLAWLWLWGTVVVFGVVAGNGLQFAMSFPRIWRPLEARRAWVSLIYVGVWLPFGASLLGGWWQTTSATARLLLVMRSASMMAIAVFPLAVVAAGVSYRLTRGGPERRQARWLVWSLFVAVLPWIVLVALPQALGLPPLLPPLVLGVLWCALPTALAIAILRERLFDIDVLINRSLVYGALSLLLVVAYFSVVVVLQIIFAQFTGEQQSQLATVLSTLTIAALFSPLRRRLQQAVDQRFFRRKYDAARTLAAFGASLRDEVELDSLSQRLVGAVQDTMQPTQSWLWLRSEAPRPEQPQPPTAVRH